ncbi:MAG TPA: carboxypeptidase regulatory-like domain-containing protein [Anaerolineales bacterium]|nr:carboxypeptidase regulatory-like domain-containing protein [Anaerolineales bacterium]HRQ91248.1 carboxypeptidase regulatory-like domain-containing protein [Anaerolineales bacterium]
MKRILLLLCGLFLAACGGQETAAPITDYTPPASVQVVLNVLVPEGTPTGEPVQLHVVDAVTGVSFNRRQVSMNSSGSNSYAITLSVPPNTLLTYQYSRQSAAGSVDEVSATGQPILYRSFLVTGAGHVAHDLIAAWADQPTELPHGQIDGRVTSAVNGDPLAGIEVRASGLSTTTDSEGRFRFDGLTQGLHNMVLTDPQGQQQSFQQGALVAAGSQTPAEIQLQPAQMASVTFILIPSETSPGGIPVFMLGNMGELTQKPLLTAHDGGYSITVQLPTGTDLRYKYTLGDGLWNAEHAADGGFILRQLIVPDGTTQLTVRDHMQVWTAGSSAPIWFDLAAPPDSGSVYLQFKLLDWATALPMWNLGDGQYAYVLYSPTNFAEPLEYRYCRDERCEQGEVDAPTRSVIGNQNEMQHSQDSLVGWP